MAIIELDKISKIYGFGDATTVALDDVDLKVNKGEFVAVMGPSGSGKSTLMNIIGLLDTPSLGTYKLDLKPVANLSEKARAIIRRKKIGFVFQSFNLIPSMRVIENVALPLMYDGVNYVERLERASKVLESMGMKEREYYRPNQLSGGQLQRAAIARALVTNPSLILADEPTGNLDTETGKSIMQILKDLNDKDHTIIMVTHDNNLANYADRIIKLVNGKIVTDGATAPKNSGSKAKTSKPKAKSPKPKAKKSATKKTTAKSKKGKK